MTDCVADCVDADSRTDNAPLDSIETDTIKPVGFSTTISVDPRLRYDRGPGSTEILLSIPMGYSADAPSPHRAMKPWRRHDANSHFPHKDEEDEALELVHV